MNISEQGVNECSGCGLCAVACPHAAIEVRHNAAGFFEPAVAAEKCVNCSICTNVCYKYLPAKEPFENVFQEKRIYGAWSKNRDTVISSSSGGVGYELTKYFRQNGYKICGCIFEAANNCCRHIVAESDADLEAIKTSKYLQSYTVSAFSQFTRGEKYLVVGSPCQIYGLRKYIQDKKWEDNFLLVDFFCHGTPSFNLWKKYKEHLCKNKKFLKDVRTVNFRHKDVYTAWHSYSTTAKDSAGTQFAQPFAVNMFFRFFLNDSCLNAACYHCKLRLDHCAADIRIADFWGDKYADNDSGVSLVITNSDRGQQAFDLLQPQLTVERCAFADLKNSQGQRFFEPHKERTAILCELQGKTALEKIGKKYFGYREEYKKTERFLSRLIRIISAWNNKTTEGI
ncbi:MAG: Coenzyme F420 hydrogenase/dehydrogenase, beta subunit C-terminal domain [Bacteroidales bacterium]|jgi:coenzyme F420-reducing hydrogenase beta subunit|nr:Coenzyme F420 hydrogenase/dehydrogenase, beta subunit C-terminal domain [Bacteroidales bacterium]